MRRFWKSPWGFAVIITALYFALNLVLTLHHEPYCDEAGTWLFAKGLSIPEMFALLKADGHPPLFYLILMPLAKLGLPYMTINIVSLLITTLAVLVVARFAPLPRWLKAVIIFSPAFTYFIPAFGRDYCLAALGMALVSATYRGRKEHPIRYAASIALLFQSHVVAAAPAGLLTLVFIYERVKQKQINRQFFGAIGVILLSFAMMALPLLSSLGTHGYLEGSAERGQSSIVAIFESLFGGNIVVGILLMIFLLYFVWYLLQYPKQLIILAGSVAAYLVICEFIYALYKPQQTAILLQLVMFACWTVRYEAKTTKYTRGIKRFFTKIFSRLELTKILVILAGKLAKNTKLKANRMAIVICVPFIFAMPPLITAAQRDLIYDFSIAKAAGRYINENLPAGSILITGNEHIASLSIAPYLEDGRKIYDAVLGQEMRYMKFDHESFRVLPYTELEQIIDDNFGGQDNIYYLVTAWTLDENGVPFYQEEREGAALEFLSGLKLVKEYHDPNASSQGVIGESYYAIYEISE